MANFRVYEPGKSQLSEQNMKSQEKHSNLAWWSAKQIKSQTCSWSFLLSVIYSTHKRTLTCKIYCYKNHHLKEQRFSSCFQPPLCKSYDTCCVPQTQKNRLASREGVNVVPWGRALLTAEGPEHWGGMGQLQGFTCPMQMRALWEKQLKKRRKVFCGFCKSSVTMGRAFCLFMLLPGFAGGVSKMPLKGKIISF